MNPIFGNRAARRAAEQEAQRAARRDRRRRRGAIATGAALVASSAVGIAMPAAADPNDGLVVNTLADPASEDIEVGDGIVSLREALSNASINDTVDDVITFDSSLTGAIELNASLTLSDGVQIHGPGADVLSILAPAYDDEDGSYSDDSYLFRASGGTVSVAGLTLDGRDYGYSVVFASDTDVTLRDVEITGGSAFRGGGVYATGDGSLTIEDSTITGNTAQQRGGGVYADDGQTVTVTDSDITENESQGYGGGIFSFGSLTVDGSTIADNTAGNGSGGGGAIAVDAVGLAAPTLTVTGSTISGNDGKERGGGIDADTAGDVVIEDSTISENRAGFGLSGSTSASADGGGLRVSGGADVTIRDTDVTDNTASRRGGGMRVLAAPTFVLTDSTISGNTASGGNGGGAYVDGADTATVTDTTVDGNSSQGQGGGLSFRSFDAVTVTDSTLSDNDASNAGGGLYVEGPATVEGTTISGNSVTSDSGDGGGLSQHGPGALEISASTVSGNSAGTGGGVYTETDDGLIENSTLSGNDATYADSFYGGGGALRIVGAMLDVVSTTITANDATAGADGIAAAGFDDPSTLTLESTILSGNGTVDLDMVDYDGTGDAGSASASHTIVGASSVDIADDGGVVLGEDPELGALADNGGPTLTHLPQVGSPVIDAGGPSELDGDQRGFSPRVVGSASDMGSVETGATDPTTTTTTVPPTTTTTTTVPPTTTTTTAAPRRTTTTTSTSTTTTTTPRPDPVVVQRPVGTQGATDVEIETSAGPVMISERGATPGSELTVTVTEVAVDAADVDTTGFEIDGMIYEVEIEGSETGGATVCFPYAGADSPTIVHWRDDGTREVLNTTVVGPNACADTTSFSPFAVVNLATDRVAGTDAAETAAAVSAATFEPGVPVAYIAARGGIADAVTAGAAGAPLLLVQHDSVPAATAAELARLDAGRVVVVGGTDIVSNAVVAQLDATRLAGADRYQTAAAVALDRFPSGAPVVYVANGWSTADALVAAAAAARDGGAVLLVDRDAVPASSAMALAARGADRVIVVGGTAVVSDVVVSSLGATRVAGADRYATAAALARESDGGDVVVARGDDPVDAVVGASLGRPLLLVRLASVPVATEAALDRFRPQTIRVLGGTSAISAQTEADVAALMAE
jgi:putative cell wall-binding protein